jgi:hypothetical protein
MRTGVTTGSNDVDQCSRDMLEFARQAAADPRGAQRLTEIN